MYNGSFENFAKLMVRVSELSKDGYVFIFSQNKCITVTHPDGNYENIDSVDDLVMWIENL